MSNENLKNAKKIKNDEFYTQYGDIQKEINKHLEHNPDIFKNKTILLPCDNLDWSNFTKFFIQNFEMLGIKKLISTSYARNSKSVQLDLFPSLLEQNSSKYNEQKSATNGKIFILERDIDGDKKTNIDNLKEDGDFRSEEVKKLRDEADIIITNPPFSLFREFIGWIFEANKSFLIVGSKNAITYKEVFKLIKENKMWLGCSQVKTFDKPDGQTQIFGNIGWFTNLEHGRRYKSLQLMTMEDNLKYSKHKSIIENGYQKYDNYDAIEVPYVDTIPSNYNGVMGVPITFLDKYSPEQFEILGLLVDTREKSDALIQGAPTYLDEQHKKYVGAIVNKRATYARIIIRKYVK